MTTCESPKELGVKGCWTGRKAIGPAENSGIWGKRWEADRKKRGGG